ncbi:MAG: acyl-CoA dehydrogenase [Bacteroidetes bacterium]|nr:acyl-CoA dehydrogenase [Bacteroidota bacterium]
MIAHPSTILQATVVERLRSGAAAAELNRDLQSDQLELIYEQGWFRMLLPEAPLSLPELVRLEEGLAWADGSVGWMVTLCSGAGWFSGFFPPGAFSDIFSDHQLCLAGSGAATGEAVAVSGGYRINGRWDYASGSLHATAFTANCVIVDGGERLVRPFLFRKEEVSVDRTWDTIGLIATGSHAFEVRDVVVPEDRCFIIDAAYAKASAPIYHYPFLQLAEATLAANLSGMAVHFLDCCEGMVRAGDVLAEAEKRLGIKRADLYRALEDSWRNGGQYEMVSKTARELATTARQVVDRLYPYGGLGAARPQSEINRVWRDLHTASQHSLLVYER